MLPDDVILPRTDSPIGRYYPGNIRNIDQTPISFDWLVGKIYATKGEKTVRVKSSGS